ncbi:right-handed parallel beta-helix repeat-containing protein [Geothrix sp. 21YS21S-2]|uniref:right-handed parallel beta-helix repeat-containing protein n=1 Tax=Geothrix sp. 21YS21S-2 TaxID=3068893 RepID=UPI0027BAC073|nr:right-handed parallel beta-helix repeat-containing protein [Geothrix sp. 21YS21S-2]
MTSISWLARPEGGPSQPGRAFIAGLILLTSMGALAAEQDPCVPPAPSSSRVVNVKDRAYGALGNGVRDDTRSIQRAIDAVAGTGGTVVFPAGTYLVDPVASMNAGLRAVSNATLRFHPGAILKAMPTTTSNYVVLTVSMVQNVTILGGTILGNRHNNSIRDEEEGGIGLKVAGSRNVFIQGVTAKDCWEDGFYVGAGARDVTLCQVVADGNRRQGLSVTSVDGLVVTRSTFRNTTGFMEKGAFVCGAGIDLEPNAGQTVANVTITGCELRGNASGGLAICVPSSLTGRAFISRVVAEDNTAIDNAKRDGTGGIVVSNTTGHRISNNRVRNSLGNGIYLFNQANSNEISGNVVTGTRPASGPGSDKGNGILLYQTRGNRVTGNTVTANAGCGLRNASPMGPNTAEQNSVSGNHPDIRF